MDDGSFDENFTWFEWGFVDPSDVRAEDGSVARESAAYATPHSTYGSGLQKWDEDHRWPT